MAVPLAAVMVVGLSGVAGGREVIRAETASTIYQYKWAPKALHTVTRGERVKWTDTTGTPHTVKFFKGPWKGKELDLSADGSVSRRVYKAGTYRYRCTIVGHSSLQDGDCDGMCGYFIRH
jgi:plastocyanin